MTNPYAHLPQVPSFTVTSTDVADGVPLPTAQMSGIFGAGGTDTSPAAVLERLPAGDQELRGDHVRSGCAGPERLLALGGARHPGDYHVTAYRRRQSGRSGPARGAVQLPNDAGLAQFLGAAPPEGHGPHRYFIVVHALDVESLGVQAGTDTHDPGLHDVQHTLGRAMIVPTAER